MAQLNDKQASALNFVLSGHSLLIMGAAGTGKSFLIHNIVEACTQKGMRVSLTCTTGIACAVYNKVRHQKAAFQYLISIHQHRLNLSRIFKKMHF